MKVTVTPATLIALHFAGSNTPIVASGYTYADGSPGAVWEPESMFGAKWKYRLINDGTFRIGRGRTLGKWEAIA